MCSNWQLVRSTRANPHQRWGDHQKCCYRRILWLCKDRKGVYGVLQVFLFKSSLQNKTRIQNYYIGRKYTKKLTQWLGYTNCQNVFVLKSNFNFLQFIYHLNKNFKKTRSPSEVGNHRPRPLSLCLGPNLVQGHSWYCFLAWLSLWSVSSWSGFTRTLHFPTNLFFETPQSSPSCPLSAAPSCHQQTTTVLTCGT